MLCPSDSFRACAWTSSGEPLEHLRRLILAWDEHASGGPGQAARALRDIYAESEGGEPGKMPYSLRDELVERNVVAKAPARGMRRGGQEADIRRVPSVYIGMPYAAADREVRTKITQMLQVGRQRVVASRLTCAIRGLPSASR